MKKHRIFDSKGEIVQQGNEGDSKVSESIYTSDSRVVPMAEVQHIEKLKRSDGNGEMVPNGLFLITKMTTWSKEMDMWENPILIPQDESEEFLKAWCFYRHELEATECVETCGTETYDPLAEIRNLSPMACGLSDCNHLPTAIKRLIDFAHQSVS
jgi:hypothetical protein